MSTKANTTESSHAETPTATPSKEEQLTQKARSLRGRVLAANGQHVGTGRMEGKEIPPQVMKTLTAVERRLLSLLGHREAIDRLVASM